VIVRPGTISRGLLWLVSIWLPAWKAHGGSHGAPDESRGASASGGSVSVRPLVVARLRPACDKTFPWLSRPSL